MITRTHPDDVDPSSSEGVDPILTWTHPDDADVDPNSSEGVDPSSSEGVDTILTQTPAKLLSVLIPNVSFRRIVRLP